MLDIVVPFLVCMAVAIIGIIVGWQARGRENEVGTPSASHNKPHTAICDMWDREGDICPVCPDGIRCGVGPCEIRRKQQ